MNHPDFFMGEALILAERAGRQGDVPVGCVVVHQGQIIARGWNCRELNHDATAHAEVQAIAQACQVLKRWRLSDCQIYVTLEPCAMCAGSILQAKIGSLYYAASESKTGCCGTVFDLFQEGLGHSPKIYKGIRAQESLALLESFFRERRS